MRNMTQRIKYEIEGSHKAKTSKERPRCGLCGKQVNLQKQNVVVSGFAMMQTSMFFSLSLEIVAIETTIDTHFVRIIITKSMRVIGRTVKDVGRILKLNCTYGMEPTSIILKNLRIPQSINRQSAQGAEKLSNWVKMDMLCLTGNICVKNAGL